MKLPRSVSGGELVRLLATLGYQPTRQSGSHVRLTTELGGQHHITVPLHDPLKAGTLNGILGDLARHHRLERGDLLALLWRA